MKFETTKSGSSVIMINNDTYLSFGTSDNIKLIHIRYPTVSGTESRMFPVALSKLPSSCTKAIGKENIKVIRDLVRNNLKDGILTRDSVMKIGETINSEGNC